jgi:restriction system protein
MVVCGPRSQIRLGIKAPVMSERCKDMDDEATAEVPSFDELMWPTLQALKAMAGSATNEELLAKVNELEGYSPEVQAVQHSDNRRTKLNYNLAWAKTYLKKVGAIENSSRGVWSLTKTGEQLTIKDVLSISARVRKQFDDDKRQLASPADSLAGFVEADELEATEPHWKDQLLAVLRGIAPYAFERLAQRLLREAGFLKVEVTGRSGDGGIDGIGVLRVNLLSFQVLFQCKRYQGSVGASAIRDFRGAMVGRSDKGLVMTTGTFTPEAKREATRDGAPAVDLIDGDQLCDLLKQLKLGVRTEMVEKMTVEPGWFDTL